GQRRRPVIPVAPAHARQCGAARQALPRGIDDGGIEDRVAAMMLEMVGACPEGEVAGTRAAQEVARLQVPAAYFGAADVVDEEIDPLQNAVAVTHERLGKQVRRDGGIDHAKLLSALDAITVESEAETVGRGPY